MKLAIVGARDGTAPDQAVAHYIDELAAALAARGDRVTVYSRRDGRRGQSGRGYDVVDVRVGPVKVTASSDALAFIGEFAESLDSMWSTDPPQVVHAHGWLPGLAAQLAARRRHLPVVQSFHGLATADDDAERRRLEPLLARSATWVAAGHSSELDALARVRRGRERVSVVPCGVDVDQFTPVGPIPDKRLPYRVLFFCSDLHSHNGFDEIIKAIRWFPDTELLIAETGWCQRADDLGVGEHVRMLGKVGQRELPALMRSADIVVWTPKSAPTASVALEAMASGVAVIATAVDAIADAVVHGVTGVMVAPGNTRELLSALKSLHAEEFRRKGMGAAGRARVRSRYTWDRIAADSQAIYREIVTADKIANPAPATR